MQSPFVSLVIHSLVTVVRMEGRLSQGGTEAGCSGWRNDPAGRETEGVGAGNGWELQDFFHFLNMT